MTSQHGDVGLRADFGSILDVDNGPAANVIGNGVTLEAGLEIGSALNEFEIDSHFTGTGTVTSASEFETYLVETDGDMWLNTVSVRAGTAFITASTGRILNGLPPLAPEAFDDVIGTVMNVPAMGNVLLNDRDPNPADELTVNQTPVSGPSNGTVILNGDGSFTYTPNPNFVGTDTFTYRVSDPDSEFDEATVTVVVASQAEVNSAPVANDDEAETVAGVSVKGMLSRNDGDPDGDAITINTTPVSAPANGTVIINTNGTFKYTPHGGFIGTDQFTYEISDPQAETAQATVTITVHQTLPQAKVNVASGKVRFFASGDIGEVDKPITSEVGSVEGESTTGGVFLVNTGNLTVGEVTSNPESITADGDVVVEASSPIFITKSVTAENIFYRAGDDASDSNPSDLSLAPDVLVIGAYKDGTPVPGGVTLKATGNIVLEAGDDFVLVQGSSLIAGGTITVKGDLVSTTEDVGNVDPDDGSTMAFFGSMSASEIEIFGGLDDDVITIDIDEAGGNLLTGHVQVFGGGGDDTITVIGGENSDSPLVIYGDTFQDGSQYGVPSGTPGDDTIDASEWFLSVAIYGGPGGDTIRGSQAGDHIAGGSGNDIISGEGGMDHIYGDSGFNFNTNLATLDLEVVTVADLIGHPSSDPLTAGEDEIHGGGGDDIIFGDHGVIEQTEGTVRVLTTGNVENIYTVEADNGATDTIHGDAGDDIIMGGKAADEIHGGHDIDLIFGDQGEVLSSGGSNQVVSYGDEAPWYEDYYYASTETQNDDAGAGDSIYGEEGGDYILGQQGADLIWGGGGDDDIYGGHNVPGGLDTGDFIDGGTGNDVIVGDNASIQRTDGDISPRFRALEGTVIYGETIDDDPAIHNDGLPLVTVDSQSNPMGVQARDVVFFDHTDSTITSTSGDDTVAGGADDDVIFGQLGNDTLHGDGQITEALVLDTLHETISGSDVGGDDYIEGNGGADTIYGGLGQDDLIGGSSSLFGLGADPTLRPDGSDTIYGGNGDMTDRNDPGDESPDGHAHDADMILGDNGNIFRLVGTNEMDSGAFLTFNYDVTMNLIPRASELLDYTPGGPDYTSTNADDEGPLALDDIGGADVIHGEAGDDFIYGMGGNDILFGEGQDDDLIGGYGHDWISGGTGQDGILGDDGRIYTSRNVAGDTTEYCEPLYGIYFVDEVNKVIRTPGDIQYAIINKANELKKTVNLAPFNVDPNTLNQDPLYDAKFADDIIYGGWGDDFLHGGAGDDAISGAEALPSGVDLAPMINYDAPGNPGDVLSFGVPRDGEFGAYNEYDPWAKVFWDPVTKEFIEPGDENWGDAVQFLLNFDAGEGLFFDPLDPSSRLTDGNDRIFGDLGNDWLVGGTGQDHLYGGWGSDLLNADDDHDSTAGSDNPYANNLPDGPEISYEDIAYGGAGRDYLIANTGGDRLIDWAGKFNSYIVPYAPLGLFTISRAPQPQLMDYLYDLSWADGCDPTRSADTGADEARNGEPEGELGLVSQRDFYWHDQTGAPDDPHPGNIPGGARDVLRGANFNSGTMEGFAVDSGVWQVESGALKVSAESLGGDAASVFHVPDMLPQYFEIQATITMEKPTAGWKANSYVIFDYYSPTDFKFAGLNASIDKIQIGHRDETGWIVDVQSNMKIKPGEFYNILVAVNGTTVTLVADNKEYFSHTFEPRVIDGWVYGLNSGMVGFGSDNSQGVFDNIAVQVLPPEITLEGTEEFPNTDDTIELVPAAGLWQANGGRYDGGPATAGDTAICLVDLGLNNGLEVASDLELETTLSTESIGGFVFDYYREDNFKFAIIDAAADKAVIGHFTKKSGWVYDATFDIAIEPGVDYDLNLSLKGTTVNLSVKEAKEKNWQAMVGHVFNAVTVDGEFGLLSKDSSSSFDALTVKTDDPAFIEPEDASALTAATMSTEDPEAQSSLTYAELDPIIYEAISRWAQSSLVSETMLSTLDDVTFLIADLPGSTLALTVDDTVIIDADAAGHGWFVDDSPYQDSEFLPQGNDSELVARESSAAYGDTDLLTVVMHELGHVFGFEDLNPEANPDDLMSATLDTGERHLLGNNGNGQSQESTTHLVAMDLTPDDSAADDSMAALVDENPWLIKYLLNGAEDDDANPNDDIALVIPGENPQSDSGDSGSTKGSSDPLDDPGSKGKGNNK